MLTINKWLILPKGKLNMNINKGTNILIILLKDKLLEKSNFLSPTAAG